VRSAYPGLTGTRLTRLDDGTFTDTWLWDTAERMRAASPATSLPEARAAMSMVRDHTARNGEIIDETYEALLAAGLEPDAGPRKGPSGNREFTLNDPDGYQLVFFSKK
jgi:hypothetical protein